MTSFYMLASLGLGLFAWILALVAIYRRHFGAFNWFSLSACGLSLLFQLMEIDHLANGLEDFSAIMDTIHAVTLAGWVLLGITMVLNGIALIRSGK